MVSSYSTSALFSFITYQGDSPQILMSLTKDSTTIQSKLTELSSIDLSGSSCVGTAINLAVSQFESQSEQRNSIIILISGQDEPSTTGSCSKDAFSESNSARSKGVPIFAIIENYHTYSGIQLIQKMVGNVDSVYIDSDISSLSHRYMVNYFVAQTCIQVTDWTRFGFSSPLLRYGDVVHFYGSGFDLYSSPNTMNCIFGETKSPVTYYNSSHISCSCSNAPGGEVMLTLEYFPSQKYIVPYIFETVASNPSSPASSPNHTGAIVGAVIGSLVGVVGLITICYCYKKKRPDPIDEYHTDKYVALESTN